MTEKASIAEVSIGSSGTTATSTSNGAALKVYAVSPEVVSQFTCSVSTTHIQANFVNTNGVVGSIVTNGSTTLQYNV